MTRKNLYSRETPFYCSIKERYALCSSEGSGKTTYHVVLDLTGSSMEYEVGDSVAIMPENALEDIVAVLNAIGAGPSALVEERHGTLQTFERYLASYANLAHLPRKLIQMAAERQVNSNKKEELEALLLEGNEDQLKKYCHERTVIDFLQQQNEVVFSPQEIASTLLPLLPRFYSIASSPKQFPLEIHLTVAYLQYSCGEAIRYGVCSRFLQEIPLGVPAVPIYIQPHKGFTLPEDSSKSIIMVGPGTGIAPFRAFMQQRILTETAGKNWLFFGERYRDYNFYYREFWRQLEEEKLLRADYAFSRDQPHKIYVQDRLMEKGEEVFNWLEEGACFYVCGDAKNMAKDVDKALHNIIMEHGRCSDSFAKSYVKELRHAKRYLRDVY